MSAHGQRVGYARVSSVDQNPARQLEALAGCEPLFTDHASGGSTDRPELQACLRHCRAGDTLVVHSMDRLARNLSDLERIVDDLLQRGVRVEFLKEGQVFAPGEANPMSKLLLQLLGAVAEFERALIRERQREGIAAAKQVPGKYRGRRAALTDAQKLEIRATVAADPNINKAALAERYGVARGTLYAALKDG